MENQEKDITRLAFHLMPPTGWMNDPNGLCQMNGIYHVFFQYSPMEAEGGMKSWGHYISKDLLHWDFIGIPLQPDTDMDRDGVYSGSAMIEEGIMHLYYTGNVKYPGNYDYISEGREGNVIHVETSDGIHFSQKELVLGPDQYPEYYTCHIRDPKVWKEGDVYYMVLGGRQKGDKGAVMLYHSLDRQKWTFCREWTTSFPMGYMWECPDCFVIDGMRVLSISPQGVKREEFRMQNVYQQGYFVLEDWTQEEIASSFKEWDLGFDFYAPQTFQDEKGRRILIGWAGVPDIGPEYHNAPTVKMGWQHALTVPREITNHDGILYQYPVEEINLLRGDAIELVTGKPAMVPAGIFDLEIEEISDSRWNIFIGEDLRLCYEDGIFEMCFLGESGCGRTSRKGLIPKLRHIRVLGDTTMIEVYLNHGEFVFTTRYYPAKLSRSVMTDVAAGKLQLWKLKEL